MTRQNMTRHKRIATLMYGYTEHRIAKLTNKTVCESHWFRARAIIQSLLVNSIPLTKDEMMYLNEQMNLGGPYRTDSYQNWANKQVEK